MRCRLDTQRLFAGFNDGRAGPRWDCYRPRGRLYCGNRWQVILYGTCYRCPIPSDWAHPSKRGFLRQRIVFVKAQQRQVARKLALAMHLRVLQPPVILRPARRSPRGLRLDCFRIPVGGDLRNRHRAFDTGDDVDCPATGQACSSVTGMCRMKSGYLSRPRHRTGRHTPATSVT